MIFGDLIEFSIVEIMGQVDNYDKLKLKTHISVHTCIKSLTCRVRAPHTFMEQDQFSTFRHQQCGIDKLGREAWYFMQR